MTKSRPGLKTLGLCALVLGLMTFGFAGVAQAEKGAAWDVLDSSGKLIEIPGASDLLPSLSAEAFGTVILEFTTGGGTLVEFKCNAVTLAAFGLESPKLLANGSLSKGKATFTECVTFLNGNSAKSCEAKSKGQSNGTIQTEEADGLIVLGTGSVPLLLVLPVVKNAKGEPLAAVIVTGELCAIGEKVEVTGHLDLGDIFGKFREHQVQHWMEEPEGFRLLKALGKPAKILGDVFLRLAGAHLNLKWSALPA